MKSQSSSGYRKCLWTEEEDAILLDYVRVHGRGRWNRIPQATGLERCGKSCRLRWMNYLRPNVNREGFTEEEDDLIIRLHNLLGNRWSLIAGRVPGRTDNQVKNHWNSQLCKKSGTKKKKNTNTTTTTTTRKRVLSYTASLPPLEQPAIPAPRSPPPPPHRSADLTATAIVPPSSSMEYPVTPDIMDFVNHVPFDFFWDESSLFYPFL